MTNSWLTNYLATREGERTTFNEIIFREGEPKIIRFLFEPGANTLIPFAEHFITADNKFYYCLATDRLTTDPDAWRVAGCPICMAQKQGPSKRLYALIIDLGDNNRVKVLKQGVTFWNRVFERKEELGLEGRKISEFNWRVEKTGNRPHIEYRLVREPQPTPLPANIIFPDGIKPEPQAVWEWFKKYVESRKITVQEAENLARRIGSGKESSSPQSTNHFSPPFSISPDSEPISLEPSSFANSFEDFSPEENSLKEEDLTNLFSSSSTEPPNLLDIISKDEDGIVGW